MEAALANTGQVAGRIDRIESVAEIVQATWRDCHTVLEQTRARLG
jgi:enoyl-[acyl-carrier protein] reductase II